MYGVIKNNIEVRFDIMIVFKIDYFIFQVHSADVCNPGDKSSYS